MFRLPSQAPWVVVLAILATSLAAPSAHAAGLLIADGGFGGVLQIQQQDVAVTINNGVAVTQVEQVFLNTENRIVEALYTFPVPKGASVSNFSMWINGKEMIGEVVEKKRAREIYESYKQTKRDPGLLEQVSYKEFEMRIFPIPAGGEQRVKVTYAQELDFDHDLATYVYPLATVTRSNIDERTRGRFSFSLEVKSEVPIASMESPSHPDDFVIASHTGEYHQASLETKAGDLSRDIVVKYKVERPRTGIDAVVSKEPNQDGYFLLTLTAGQELEQLGGGMDYVFLLDISGSMSNDRKLRLSRESIGAFIAGLSPEDRFEVITFNVSANRLFGQLESTNAANLDSTLEFLDSQQARGGTILKPALNAAYQYQDSDRTLNVVLLSDGMTEQREHEQLLQLISQRPAGSRVFCIGVGNEVNRPLLGQMAEDAGGLAAFLSHGDDFQQQAKAFRRKLVRPAVTNLSITLEDAGSYDVLPETLPNLYHGSPVRLYGRYRKSGPTKVQIEGEVLGGPFKQSLSIDLAEADASNPQIERMWAWHRVQALANQDRARGLSKNTGEIVALCEEYSIVSEHASFIVLENDAEYRRWKIDRRNSKRVQRDRQAELALRQKLDRMREQAIADMRPVDATRTVETTTASSGASPARQQSSTDNGPASNRDLVITPNTNRSRGGAGGGAIDPITGTIALGIGGASALAARRRKRLTEKREAKDDQQV